MSFPGVVKSDTSWLDPFSPPLPFRPAWWIRGPHSQTVLPFFIPTGRVSYQAQQHVISLEDGDELVLHEDRPARWSDGDRAILLVHGLAGSHGSRYLVRLAASCVQRGFCVWRMDMRGCGAGLLLARGVFHADRHRDLLQAVQHLSARIPNSPLTIVGFSLGGNLTLKMLGAAKSELPSPVDSAIVVSPPIDLSYCCRHLSRGMGWMYDVYFSRVLWCDFQKRRAIVTGADRVKTTRRPRTLLEFDRQVTAPLAGFSTVEEYYAAASSQDVVGAIEVPVVVLAASDDPIVPLIVYRRVSFSPSTRLYVTGGGGHLGFYGHERPQTTGESNESRASGLRWMERQVVRWIEEWNRHCSARRS